MKEVIILGTGGLAAELVSYIYANNKYYNGKTKIKGYLDINDNNYKKYNFIEPFLGNENEYNFNEKDIVYIAIGNDRIRNNLILLLENKNIIFENFIHYTALISRDSTIGRGNIIGPNVIVGPNTIIGDFNLINYNCSIAHDSFLGNRNIFSPNVNITGYCTIGNENFFSLSTGLTPNIKIGNNNKIQAGIIVNKDVENDSIVFSLNQIKTIPIYKK